MNTIIPVILAGGQGSRLWPLSMPETPKQCLPLLHESLSLLQQTLLRARDISREKPLVICHEDQRFLVAEQCRALNIPVDIILEPHSRNTAQATALAAAFYQQQNRADALLLMMPADHALDNPRVLLQAVQQLQPFVAAGAAGIFGIEPTHAATEYGYLQVPESGSVQTVLCFREKPDAETAQQWLTANSSKDGARWLWNSGVFFWQAAALNAAFQQVQPVLFSAAQQAMQAARTDLDFIRPDAGALENSPALPLDIALLEPLTAQHNGEQTSRAVVAVALENSGWNDIGSFAALGAYLPADAQNNRVQGDARLYATQNTLVYNRSGRDIAVNGVRDLMIIDTPDALLISHKDSTAALRAIAADAPAQEPQQVFRPWGNYQRLHTGQGYKIKRLQVKPGGQLSLQRHQERAEHWVVVRGEATVIREQNGVLTQAVLHANESTFIAVGDVHSLANHGNTLLEMIEVQSGDYLGEDDIERLQDIYGRQ